MYAVIHIQYNHRKKFHGEVEKHGDHFLWKIPRFRSNVAPGWPAFSPYFEHAGRTWGLQISDSNDQVRLVLKNYCDKDDSDSVTLGLKVDETFMLRRAKPDVSGRLFKASKVMSCEELFRLANEQILPGETLTVFCRIAAHEKNIEEEKQQHELESIENLQQNIGDLLYNKYFSDVVFLVQSTFMQAHRNILSARSPVLATMVSRDSDVNNPIRIPDVDQYTFSDFLYYLYTGGFKKMNRNVAARLHPLAERYQVPELKDECEPMMKKKSVEEEPISLASPSSSKEKDESVTPSSRKGPPKKRKRKS